MTIIVSIDLGLGACPSGWMLGSSCLPFFAACPLSFVLFLFYFVPMTPIDSDSLATHLEVALNCAPVDTIAALQDTDRQRRRRATYTLAQYLAVRSGCFEITGDGLGEDMGKQASLFRRGDTAALISSTELPYRTRHKSRPSGKPHSTPNAHAPFPDCMEQSKLLVVRL